MKRLVALGLGGLLALGACTASVGAVLATEAEGTVLAAAAPCAPAASADGPVASEGRVTLEQLGQLVLAAGFADLGADVPAKATATFWHESGQGQVRARNPSSGAAGLAQVMPFNYQRLGLDPDDPEQNLRMAKMLADERVKAGRDPLGPWVSYTAGRYLQYLDEAEAALSGATPVAPCAPGSDPTLVDPGDGPMDPPSGGYRPRAANVKALALQRWGCEVRPAPCLDVVGGYEYRNIAGTGTLSDHATGRAADIMIPSWSTAAGKALGDTVAAFFVANAANLGISYVIFYDRIWNPSTGWQPYGHPGGVMTATYQHRDHVHVSTL